MVEMSRAFAILLVSLFVVSQSLPIRSAHASGLTVIQVQHNQWQLLEARQLLRSSDHHDQDQSRKLRTYTKKRARASAGRGYIATRGRRHRSAAIQTSHISSFQVASVLASSLLLGFLLL